MPKSKVVEAVEKEITPPRVIPITQGKEGLPKEAFATVGDPPGSHLPGFCEYCGKRVLTPLKSQISKGVVA